MPGKKLLVADDSLTIQKVIRLALSNEGYEIQAVSDGNDTLQQISLFQPDVVLIDVSLPGKSAFEVKKEINEHEDLAEIRFILMSSAFEKVDEVQCESVKFHGRLIKPFDPAHLRQTLTDALNQVTAQRMEKTTLIHTTDAHSLPPHFPPPHSPPGLPPLPADPLWEPGQDPMEAFPPPLPTDSPFQSNSPSPLPPPLPPPQVPTSSPEMPPPLNENDESDIRELTESTIRQSGLNDFQWNVKEPSLKPFPDMLDRGGSNFPSFDSPPGLPPEIPSGFPSSLPPELPSGFPSRLSPELPPELPLGPPPELPPELPLGPPSGLPPELPLGESHLGPPSGLPPSTIPDMPDPVISHFDHPSEAAYAPPPPNSFDGPGSGPFASTFGKTEISGSLGGLSSEQLENLIKKQVEDVLHKLTQKTLPEIAEKIVKAEIHKLLSE